MLLRGIIRLSLSDRIGGSCFTALGFKLISNIKAIKPSNVNPELIGEVIVTPALLSLHSVRVEAIHRRRLHDSGQEH